MIVRSILTNQALRRLVVDQWDADRVVAYYEDGPVVEEALQILRTLMTEDDMALIDDALGYIDALVMAQQRRLDP